MTELQQTIDAAWDAREKLSPSNAPAAVREVVDIARRHAGNDLRRQVVEEFRRQTSGDTHAVDVGGGLEADGHGFLYARSSSLMLVFERVFASTCLTITAQ